VSGSPERWRCPVRECYYQTKPFVSDDPELQRYVEGYDVWTDLERHLRQKHNLDGGEASDIANRVEKDEWRIRNIIRLQVGRDRMYGWTLDTFPAADVAGRRALKAVREWNELDEKWTPRVFLYGAPGTGKTGLAYAMCWRWIHLDLEFPEWGEDVQDYKEIVFCNMRQYLAEQQARMSRGEGTDFEPLLTAGLVVLDDLGAERPTAWALDKIALTIEGRYETNKTLVVTSNYAPNELAARLGHEDPMVGQRLVSRLTDGALVIRLDRRDLRAARSDAA
jgi:DNA replication protein DnaC